MKKTIALLSALAMLSAMAVPFGAFAEDTTTKELNKTTTSGDTEVSYDVQAKYTITIPAGVTLSDTAETTASVEAENVMLESGKNIVVKLTAATNTTSGTTFHAKNGSSVATYTINGAKTIGLDADNNTVATFGTSTTKQTQTLTFSKAENATYAGKHTEQLTFTISVVSGE